MLKVPTSATVDVDTEIIFPETVNQVNVGENEKVFAPHKVGLFAAAATLFGNGVVCAAAGIAAIW